ncbi:MAG: 3-isopropylmalate dehydratase large subunit [Acidobacteria bacterium]|nr:3-isopropylmalate dehydratase large subunit [Acidobacteriota bacterium]
MPQTLFEKVWNQHAVRRLPSGQTQLYIGLHLIHEVTSPQAFDMLRVRGWRVRAPQRTFATVDHIVPTGSQARPFADLMAEQMAGALERNCREHNIPLFDLASGRQGIVHVIGPELGLTQPGMTIACGDSHTSTHGAFGALAFGIGTSQVRDVLASQCIAMSPLKVRRIEINGHLAPGVYAKDVILSIIQRLGVEGGVGYAYEYAGDTIDRMTMEERMTICNMSIEGGARIGYVNPDAITAEYLRNRPFAPSSQSFASAAERWLALASDAGSMYEDRVSLSASDLAPTVTWGTHPGQSVGVDQKIPISADVDSLMFMGLSANTYIVGAKIDVAFIGSCTNGRLSDLREAARVVGDRKVATGVRAIVVPGSQAVRAAAEAEGLHEVFLAAGFEWRGAGCSMCLAMNPDKLNGREICASSSNRNFKGRQGSPTGRTLLMSPAMVAAAAIEGAVVDVRQMLGATA